MSLPEQQTHQHIATFLGKIKTTAKVVIGIDFGTTYSGISFAYRRNPSVVNCGAPGLSARDSIKVPTVLLQRPEGWLFGQEALEQYKDYVEDFLDNQFDFVAGNPNENENTLASKGIFLYRFFKLRLKGEESGVETLVAKSTSGHSHKLMDLVVESLRALGNFARKEVQTGFGGALDIGPEDILWVLTVPAIWNDFGKAFMRKAAFQSGLVSSEASNRLLLALEPECASIAVHQEGCKFGLFKEGSTFMILDCGGGTVDITTHKVASEEPLVLDQVSTPEGGAWGSMFVDLQFSSVFLKEFLGANMLEKIKQRFPNELESLTEKFRQLKEGFTVGSVKSKSNNRISFAELLQEDIRAELGLSDLEKLVQDYNFNKGSVHFDLGDKQLVKKMRRDCVLTFTDRQVLDFFEPTLKKICDCVQSILSREDIATIVLVGGYGSSTVLGDRVRSTFEADPYGVKVIVPDSTVHPQAAIVHGAAYYGLYTSVIGIRIPTKTYGIATNEKWFDGCRFSEKESEWDATLSERRVDNVFVPIVKRGTKIKPGETFKSLGYSPLYPSQKHVGFNVFQSDLFTPKFATALQCDKVGEVKVPVRHDNDKFDVYFTFGSELRVEIVRQDGDRHFEIINID